MKFIKYINAVAIGIPLILAGISLLEDNILFWAAYSTMLTGLLQVIAALIMFILGHNRNLLYIYFATVILYFTGMYLNIDGYYVYYIPALLVIYLTFIIYKKNKP